MCNKNHHKHFLWEVEKLLKESPVESYSGKKIPLSSLCRNAITISENVGNNSFSYSPKRSLHIAPVFCFNNVNDIVAGDKLVFADIWDGKLRLSTGLKHYLVGETIKSTTPFYLCDNHNLVLEAWSMTK